MARTSGAVQGIMFLIVLAAVVRQQRLRRHRARMPGWLQAFVKVNPITHLVDAVRGLMLGGPVADHLLLDAGLDGRAAGGLRPARDARLPASDLTPTRVGQVDRVRATRRPTSRPLLMETAGAQHLSGAGGDLRNHQVGRVICSANARGQTE